VNYESLTDMDLASHLASALGETKALEVVRAAAAGLQIPREQIQREQAYEILDAIAKEPGLVGITASFVKSRLILQWG